MCYSQNYQHFVRVFRSISTCNIPTGRYNSPIPTPPDQRPCLKTPVALPLTLSNEAALEPYERALVGLRTYRGDPIAPIDEALALVARLRRRVRHQSVDSHELLRAALRATTRSVSSTGAQRASANATQREKCAGRRRAQARDRRLARGCRRPGPRPRRAPARHRSRSRSRTSWTSSAATRSTCATASRACCRHWSPTVPGYSFVLGMHAFGLEEMQPVSGGRGDRTRARSTIAPEDCWAVHAVTHVMEMQGRIDEGMRFLEARKRDWAAATTASRSTTGGTSRSSTSTAAITPRRSRSTTARSPPRIAMALSRARRDRDALAAAPRGRRRRRALRAVADAWSEALDGEGGFYAFNDFHAALAFAGAGRDEAIAPPARRARAGAAWQQSANGAMTRDGRPSTPCEGLSPSARALRRRAVDKIVAVRDVAPLRRQPRAARRAHADADRGGTPFGATGPRGACGQRAPRPQTRLGLGSSHRRTHRRQLQGRGGTHRPGRPERVVRRTPTGTTYRRSRRAPFISGGSDEKPQPHARPRRGGLRLHHGTRRPGPARVLRSGARAGRLLRRQRRASSPRCSRT